MMENNKVDNEDPEPGSAPAAIAAGCELEFDKNDTLWAVRTYLKDGGVATQPALNWDEAQGNVAVLNSFGLSAEVIPWPGNKAEFVNELVTDIYDHLKECQEQLNLTIKQKLAAESKYAALEMERVNGPISPEKLRFATKALGQVLLQVLADIRAQNLQLTPETERLALQVLTKFRAIR